jgi:secreted trypsin-like serine protease
MKRLLILSFLAAGTLVPTSLARAASASASPTPTSVHTSVKMHTDIAGGAVGSVAGVVEISTPSQYCTGAVIAPKVVLTAAHCLEDVTSPGTIQVRVQHAHQMLTVSRFYKAPGFNPATHDDDAAVLILKSPAKGATLPVLRTEPLTGTGARITGYGQHTYTSAVASVAYQADTTIQSFASCQAAWGRFGSAVPSSDMCAENSSDTSTTLTRGDSGGPLLVKSQAGDWAIAGINDLVVIPNDVYSGTIPQAFERVDTIRAWIESKIVQVG